jgi:hypothetical protein
MSVKKDIYVENMWIDHMHGQFTIRYSVDGKTYEQSGLGVYANCFKYEGEEDTYELYFEVVKSFHPTKEIVK